MKLKFSATKLFVAVVLAFIGLDLWYALVYLPAKAEKEWEVARKALIDRGEKLAITDFVPEKVPDERNFFADPLWAELHDREPVTKNGYVFQKGRKPSGEWRIAILQKPFTEGERQSLEAEFPAFAPLDGEKKKLAVLREYWDAAKKSGDTTQAAKFILKALAPSEPVIARLWELGERPEARYPLVYEDGPMMGIEHITPTIYASEWLQLHASALLAQGKTDEAFRDVQLVLRLAKALEHEQILIIGLVDMATVNAAAHMVGRGIRDHAWSEAQLIEFDRQLAPFDFPARLAAGLRAERAMWLETTIPLVKKHGVRFLAEAGGLDHDGGLRDVVGAPVFWAYCLYGMPGDKAFYSRAIQNWAEALDRAPTEGMRPGHYFDFVEDYRENNTSDWDTARRISSLLSLNSLKASFRNAARKQTEVSQTRIAIALERYRMKHGEYPENLDAVVPEFLAKLPLDLVTMEPFLYRQEESGEFVLWSVGWDETDDRGVPGKKSGEGDWVWGE